MIETNKGFLQKAIGAEQEARSLLELAQIDRLNAYRLCSITASLLPDYTPHERIIRTVLTVMLAPPVVVLCLFLIAFPIAMAVRLASQPARSPSSSPQGIQQAQPPRGLRRISSARSRVSRRKRR